MSYFRKDPDETDYQTIDWSRDLDTGETISTVSWTLDSGITNASSSNTTTTTTIFLADGTDGNTYAVTCSIVTSTGRELDHTIHIEVSPK